MGGFNSCLDLLLRGGPDVFQGVQIWAKRGPVHRLDVVVVKVGLCGSGRVSRGVVVLKDVVASAGQEGHNNGLQHFPDVTLSGGTPTSAWLENFFKWAPADDHRTCRPKSSQRFCRSTFWGAKS